MDAVEEIKSRLNIEDVVGEYVQLKRAGRNFKGLSPFTSERTPSFMVSPEKGIWHDFSSGKGGNIFSFVMEMEGLDFKGAMELLARKANIDLTQYQTGRSAETGKLKDRLYQALELAARFYQVQFSKSTRAIDYVFKKRQFDKKTVLAFRLGYAPNNGSALVDFLEKKGFSDKELQQAGLTARRYRGGMQDMFRGRLMIPLMDPQGRVIGFTARLLEDEPNAPKYINTPQTLLYDKGRHIFGLHLAKEGIRREGYVVLVEGNLDVIASHQARVTQIVATAGTALTEMHLKGLSRFTADIRLSFDQDKAGQAATERAIPIASKVGISLSMITIPEGKDPDDLVRKDPELWRQAITKTQYALDWLIDRYSAQLDLNSAQGKRHFSDVLLHVVRRLEDEVEQDHYLTRIAEIIGVSKAALHTKLHGIEAAQTAPRLKGRAVPVTDPRKFDPLKIQNHYLCLVMLRPRLREHMSEVTPGMLVTPEAGMLLQFLKSHPDFDGSKEQLKKLIGKSLPKPVPIEDSEVVQGSTLLSLGDYVKMLSLQYEALYQDLDDVELGYEVARLRVRLIEQYVKTKKAELATKMRGSANERETLLLLEQAKELDKVLKDNKGA